jgi:hypothetical protein
LPITVAGSLDGTPLRRGLIGVNTVLNMSIDGVPVAGPFTSQNSFGGEALVSANVYRNDFFFFSSTVTPAFIILPPGLFSVAEVFFSFSAYAVDSPAVQANWSLYAVPEGGLTIAMLGMATAGLAFLRRKLPT